MGQFLNRPAGRALEHQSVQPARQRIGKTGWLGRTLLLLTGVSLLAGCSLGLVYPRLDTIVAWQLDRYLRLESVQERWLDERLEERLAWHQREQLPQWRAALAALRSDLAEQQLDADRYRQHSDRVRELIQATMAGLVADSVQLGAGLNDRQIAHLFEHFDEETEELKEELADIAAEPEEQAAARFDDVQDGVEDWLGNLTAAQRDYIKQWSEQTLGWDSPVMMNHMLESRQRWRERVQQTLAARSDAEALAQQVTQLMLNPESLRSAPYQAAIDQLAEQRQSLHFYLLQTLTDQQRAHLLAELDDLLEDLDELMEE